MQRSSAHHRLSQRTTLRRRAMETKPRWISSTDLRKYLRLDIELFDPGWWEKIGLPRLSSHMQHYEEERHKQQMMRLTRPGVTVQDPNAGIERTTEWIITSIDHICKRHFKELEGHRYEDAVRTGYEIVPGVPRELRPRDTVDAQEAQRLVAIVERMMYEMLEETKLAVKAAIRRLSMRRLLVQEDDQAKQDYSNAIAAGEALSKNLENTGWRGGIFAQPHFSENRERIGRWQQHHEQQQSAEHRIVNRMKKVMDALGITGSEQIVEIDELKARAADDPRLQKALDILLREEPTLYHTRHWNDALTVNQGSRLPGVDSALSSKQFDLLHGIDRPAILKTRAEKRPLSYRVAYTKDYLMKAILRYNRNLRRDPDLRALKRMTRSELQSEAAKLHREWSAILVQRTRDRIARERGEPVQLSLFDENG